MLLLLPLILAGPLIMVSSVLVARGPLGWVAAFVLVVAVLWATRLLLRRAARWWRELGPAAFAVSGGGTDPASVARPGLPGGTSPG